MINKMYFLIPIVFYHVFCYGQVPPASLQATNPWTQWSGMETDNLNTHVIYTDIIPDKTLTAPYNLDLNKDSITDLIYDTYWDWGFTYNYLTPQNNSSLAVRNNFIDTLNINDLIDNSLSWNTGAKKFVDCDGNDCIGNWLDVQNKFVGVRIIKSSDTLYGWIRFNVVAEYQSKIILKDYACSEIPNQPVLAGQGIKPAAENVKISDISDYKDGRDMYVSFERSLEETKVNEYRILVVKSEEASAFNLDSAENVLPVNYITVLPDGNDFGDTLSSNARDKDGDPVVEFIPYNIFVLSITDSTCDIANALSNPSNKLTLTSPAKPAANIRATATYTGRSLYQVQVTFDRIADETTISEYRIIFVNGSEIKSFNVDSANRVSSPCYYPVVPEETNYLKNFRSDSILDKSGDPVQFRTDYYVYVLSIADGIKANVNSLTKASESFILSTPAVAPKNVFAEDIGSNKNASDLQLSFQKIPDESEILEYRVIAVKLDDSENFTIDEVDNIPPENYFSIAPNGNDILVNLTGTARDKDGNLITEQVPYRIFVLSVCNRITTDVNALSMPSNIITLSTPDYFKAGQSTGDNVIYVDLDPDTIIEASYESETDFYYLDMNKDGINDFYVRAEYIFSSSHSIGSSFIVPLDNNQICVDNSLSTAADTLTISSMINQSLFWCNNKSYFSSYYISYMAPYEHNTYGIWDGITNNYAGLKLVTDQNIFYGWLRLDAPGPTHLIIKDYAYQNIMVDIEKKVNRKDLSIFPNPAYDRIYLQTERSRDLSIEIININGQNLFYSELKNNNKIYSIDISSLPEGLYFIRVRSDEFIHTEKVIKY